MQSEKYIENLRKSLLLKMESDGCTLAEMSIKCDISVRRLSDIICGKTKNMYLDTFVKICKNNRIPLADVLEIDDSEIFENRLKRLIISDEKNKYKLQKF